MKEQALLEKILAPIGQEAERYVSEICNNFMLLLKDEIPESLEGCLLSENEIMKAAHEYNRLVVTGKPTEFFDYDKMVLKAQLNSPKLAAYIQVLQSHIKSADEFNDYSRQWGVDFRKKVIELFEPYWKDKLKEFEYMLEQGE